jgi:hypothetical protein
MFTVYIFIEGKPYFYNQYADVHTARRVAWKIHGKVEFED